MDGENEIDERSGLEEQTGRTTGEGLGDCQVTKPHKQVGGVEIQWNPKR